MNIGKGVMAELDEIRRYGWRGTWVCIGTHVPGGTFIVGYHYVRAAL